jgi:glycosyltransferase involved in cell wall biosynthesis
MISGFMIVKNVLGQGYPFVEAIASALPICDEFLISDGYSTDGTYEIVKRISSLNSKVMVHRYQWPDKKDITILADVTNEVRSKCRFQYIFSVQANEVVHEQSAPFIKALPSMLPNVDTFSFPYIQLLSKYKFTEEFRLRFSKNLPRIVATGDAWTLGTSRAFDRAKKLRCLAYPPRLFGYLNNGIWFTYANSCYGPHSRAIYLPKPIFRYWSLFPKNFLEKYQRHAEIFQLPNFQKSSDILRSHVNDPETFWRLGSETLKQTRFKERPQYPEAYSSVDRKDHPAIIQEFISNPHADQYYVREEMFELLRKL